MLSLFPQILFLAPLGTTLLRVAAAFCFAYMASHFWQERQSLTGLRVPIVGHLRLWMVLVSEAAMIAIVLLLVLGAWTQAVALLGALVCLKQLLFFRRYHSVFPFERSTYLLLLCICLMLAVTGPGAFAFDLSL